MHQFRIIIIEHMSATIQAVNHGMMMCMLLIAMANNKNSSTNSMILGKEHRDLPKTIKKGESGKADVAVSGC